ncbi:hypothetical protein R1sor_003586 [Riccia sorocarpa]|uniref:Phosphate acetyl/butaryl transferase domain-containing protein n=1 Tax=Riccia sorocarpa TaxID=122646 RepID=A0ABD3H866_9MARC
MAQIPLSDLLAKLPRNGDPRKDSVVITDWSSLAESPTHASAANIAALVLTNGKRPEKCVEQLVQVPISPQRPLETLPSFESSALLSKADATIEPRSYPKIERAQLIFNENVDMDVITKALLKEQPARVHPVLPESSEPRTVQAAGIVLNRDLCEVTLVGNKQAIEQVSKQYRIEVSREHIVDPPVGSVGEDCGLFALHHIPPSWEIVPNVFRLGTLGG